jgi:hypothetical protein
MMKKLKNWLNQERSYMRRIEIMIKEPTPSPDMLIIEERIWQRLRLRFRKGTGFRRLLRMKDDS